MLGERALDQFTAQSCTAKEAECYTCKKKGHFSSQCFSKSIADMSSMTESTDEYYDIAFPSAIGAGTPLPGTAPYQSLDAPFKLDTNKLYKLDRGGLTYARVLSPYWQVRGALTIHEDLLLYGSCIVVPKRLHTTTLQKIHKLRASRHPEIIRVSSLLWWPGVSEEIEQLVQSCLICAKDSTPHKEPSMGESWLWSFWTQWEYLPTGCGLFHYIEIQKISSTNSKRIKKAIFSRHGIPAIFVIDNSPQYTSWETQEFAQSYGFKHVTSIHTSPRVMGWQRDQSR